MHVRATANIPQSQFLALPHKNRAFVAGYGSGKTWVGAMAKCMHYWQHPKINQGYFAPTYPQIRDIFYPTIDEVAFNMGLRVDIKEANKEVHFYSGNTYRGTTICRSMERPATIIGFKIGHALVDELDVMEAKKAMSAWRKILARMRYNNPGLRNGIDVTTTPEGFRTTHALFVQALIDKPDLANSYGLIQASTYDNEANLPEDYIQSLIDAYPEELIAAYLNGQFVNLNTGTVYRSYNRVRHNSTETIQPHDVLRIGMDFNVMHMAATIYVVRDNGWHAVAELKDVFDTPDMVRILKERYHDHRKIIYPDASGDNRKSQDASRSDIAILRQAGFEIKVSPSNPAVKDRINAVNKQFQLGKLWVNAKACPATAKCLEQQAYDDNGEPDKRSGFDHQCFHGDQLVTVNGESMAFKEIPSDGVVLCHDGKYRPYQNGGKIKDSATMLLVTLSNGVKIRCTPDHKFLTLSGWVEAINLKGEILCNQELLARLHKNTAEKDITCAASIFSEQESGFTGKFGKIIMATFQKAGMSTIKTMTETITGQKIFASCRMEFIRHIMEKIKRACLKRLSKLQGFGMGASKDLNGIAGITKKQKNHCTAKTRSMSALGAEIVFFATKMQGFFARKHAQQPRAEQAESTTRKEIAQFVASLLRSISTDQIEHALGNAPQCLQVEAQNKSDAYCLTVPGFGMFELAGVIVSNCDATGYPIAHEYPIISAEARRMKLQGL